MTQPQQAPADPNARQRLLQAAAELFARKGYAATTVREIVAAAGVTKPVLYYYFQHKEGLYLELMEAHCQRFFALIEGPSSSGDGVAARLKDLADRSFQVFKDNLKVMQTMYAIYYGPPQGAPVVDFDSVYLAFHQAVFALVQEGQARGELRPGDPLVFTWMLMANVHMAMEMEMCLP
ncbi:MAG: TetR/AcrR family transcriptional regulator, partial [Desulfovibrio sp.]|nr:TetR/AcrR family transcriptional regulator [Desulfovibrio sp.]